MSPKDLNKLDDQTILQVCGTMTCDSPNEYLDKWDGNVIHFMPGKPKVTINVR